VWDDYGDTVLPDPDLPSGQRITALSPGYPLRVGTELLAVLYRAVSILCALLELDELRGLQPLEGANCARSQGITHGALALDHWGQHCNVEHQVRLNEFASMSLLSL